MAGQAWIGTSGWAYPRWRGDFYPRGLVQRRELEYAAGQMTSLEINGSFYSLKRPSSYRAWREQTPDGFVLAVKGSRFITHMKRLVDVATPMGNFLASGVLALGPKLGPLLWQLPEQLTYDPDKVEAFLQLLPRTTGEAAELARGHDERVPSDRAFTEVEEDRPLRHALEFRSPSFDDQRLYDQLAAYDVACVLSDTPHRWPIVDRDTASFRYLRLHGHEELYASGYGEQALAEWAERIRPWLEAGDVYCYFDNDARGHAPHDAVALLRLLDAAPG